MPDETAPMRPQRFMGRDFAGRPITLAAEPQNWQLVHGSGNCPHAIVLDTGPAAPVFLAEKYEQISFLNAQDGLQRKDIPENWQECGLEDVIRNKDHCDIFLYRQAEKLAPDFWAPLLAQLEIVSIPTLAKRHRAVWLPGQPDQLLHLDILRALENSGFPKIYQGLPTPGVQSLKHVWQENTPEFAISVNFRGLDAAGRIFGLCQALEVPVAIWLVDNPWNLLSGISLPWWKKANLFVTDASFIEPLKDAGAKHVYHLPLAASFHMLRNFDGKWQKGPLFVGRSAFPGKERFFAGITPPAHLLKEAEKLAGAHLRPDFHWWAARQGVKLWPGKDGRKPACGAEWCSAKNRAAWLQGSGIKRIIGDDGWKKYLPNADIQAPVDYYGSLPELYAQAEAVLNVTSWLLPQSLNQRHFDVWAAGGFLLTDYTKGLEIFPAELVQTTVLESPVEFGPKLQWLAHNPQKKRDLAQAWHNLIKSSHLYEHRILEIMRILNLTPPRDDRINN